MGPRTRTRGPAHLGAALKVFGAAAAFAYPLALPFLLSTSALGRFADRSDRWWLLAFALLVGSSFIHGRWDPNVLGVLAAWAVHRGARWTAVHDGPRTALRRGAVLGASALALHLALEAVVGGSGRASGPSWFFHPNVFAHAWLVLGLGLALPAVPQRWRAAALLVAMLVLVATGSRSGIVGSVALLLGMIGQRFVGRKTLVALALAAATAVAVGHMAGAPWADRIVGPVRALVAEPASPNRLVGTEELAAHGAWTLQDVEVLASTVSEPPAAFSVIRTTAVDWARVQQTVTLQAGRIYTLSGEFQSYEGSEPGFLAWGSQGGQASEIRVGTQENDAGRFAGNVSPRTVRRVPLEAGWTRVEVTFVVVPDRSIDLAIGVSPDLASPRSDRRGLVRAIQLELGSVATPYEPASGTRVAGIGEAVARLPYWHVAWQGIRESPAFGWGPTSFAGYYAEHSLEPDAQREPPTHPHNQFLTTAFEGGVLGLVTLAVIVAALAINAGPWSRWVLAGVLVANAVDSTLFTVLVLFPLAFLSGWDSTSNRRSIPGAAPSAGWGKMKR